MKLVDFLKFFFHEETILLKCPCEMENSKTQEVVEGVYFIKTDTVENFLNNDEYDEYLECNVLPDGACSNFDNTDGNYIEISIDYKTEG